MPYDLPWSALFLAAALLWPPRTRRWALVPLAAAWGWALAGGVAEPSGTSPGQATS